MKIYLETEDEIERYRRLGIPIHRGPRGGIYILSEDLSKISLYQWGETNIIEEDLHRMASALSSLGDVDIYEEGDGISFNIPDGRYSMNIWFSANRIDISTLREGEWEISDRIRMTYDNPESFATGLHVLLGATALVGNKKKFDEMHDLATSTSRVFQHCVSIPKSKYGKLKLAIIDISLLTGRKNFSKLYNAKTCKDFMRNIQWALGPWLGSYVKADRLAQVKTGYLNTKDFYKDLQEMFLVAGAVGNIPEFHFISSELMNGEVFAYYLKGINEIYLPIDDEKADNWFYRKAMWHEFQHYLYHNLNFKSNDFGPMMAFKMARLGMLTNYAKTNDNEALSEFVGLYAEGTYDNGYVGKLYEYDRTWRYTKEILKWLREKISENAFKYAGG